MTDVHGPCVEGFDGRNFEYCPYTETSKDYDKTRAPNGMHVVLGSLALNSKPVSQQRLLDVGCGTGTFLEQVAPFVKEACGLEYNDGMISEATARLGDKIKITQGSADNLPFADGSFDAVTINQVIHHFPVCESGEEYGFFKKFVAEAYRVLAPGGHIVINTSAPEQQRDGFWWLALFPKASDVICKRFPPIETISAAMTNVGFATSANSVAVLLQVTLMAPDMYLKHGIDSAFEKWYRHGDSSWSMAEGVGELEEGLERVASMKKDGTAGAFMAEREALRKRVGQVTIVTACKKQA